MCDCQIKADDGYNRTVKMCTDIVIYMVLFYIGRITGKCY